MLREPKARRKSPSLILSMKRSAASGDTQRMLQFGRKIVSRMTVR